MTVLMMSVTKGESNMDKKQEEMKEIIILLKRIRTCKKPAAPRGTLGGRIGAKVATVATSVLLSDCPISRTSWV
jgi:hypothetical protein